MQLIDTNSVAKVIGRGFEWSEGPLWIAEEKMLLFTDVPENKIYAWKEGEPESKVWLENAGYTGAKSADGANGLLLNNQNQLIICQHGDRRIAQLVSSFTQPAPEFKTITGEWMGKRFNSPNDACFVNDTLYFTDPPYGLKDTADREIPFNGVYMFTNGQTTLLVDSLQSPNGIATSPDGKYLYVANSHYGNPVWLKYLRLGDSLQYIKTIDLAIKSAQTEQGLPDGLKFHPSGIMFASGPGGIWILNNKDDLIGKIKFDQAVSNCAFDNTFTSLFVTADSLVYKISLRK